MAMFSVLTDSFGIQHVIELPEPDLSEGTLAVFDPEDRSEEEIIQVILQEVDEDGSGKPVTCIRILDKE